MANPFGGGALIAHPDSPARAVEGVYFTYLWKGAAEWRFDFFVKAPPAALKLPVPVEPGRGNDLWNQSHFAVRLRDPMNSSNLELGFSPSGQWAANRFDGDRTQKRELELAQPLQIFTSDPTQAAIAIRANLLALGIEKDSPLMRPLELPETPTHFALFAHCDDTGLRNETPWRAQVSAVIEEVDGTKSYWALAHPPGRPDFHNEDGFVLELPSAMTESEIRSAS